MPVDDAEIPVFYESHRVGTVTVAAGARPDAWARAVLPDYDAGRRRRAEPPAVGFSYAPSWLATRGAFPISTRFPLGSPVDRDAFQVWASNLLPESGHLRNLGQAIGVDTGDVVGLLSRIGRDTAGALSIGAPGITLAGHAVPVPDGAALERVIEELPAKPFLAGEDGVSMSLAGAQSKLGVALAPDGRIAIPVDGAPSTHILKPDSKALFGGVQNEALCMTLAGLCGLPVPAVTTGLAGARSYFLVERYDRFVRDGRIRRRHQEDMAQALGVPPGSKYESNSSGTKGPSAADMFGVARASLPPADVALLLDQFAFNVLVANTDAHAKNYSMIIMPGGARMAPIYDVMCSSVWSGITPNMAQKVAGKSRGDHLQERHWFRFAQSAGLRADDVVGRVERLGRAVLANVDAARDRVLAMPAGGHCLLDDFAAAVASRARRVLAGLDVAAPVPVGPVPRVA